jgi:hypothetical protein
MMLRSRRRDGADTADRAVEAMRVALGEQALAAAWAAGQAMTPEEAIATALEDGAGD